MKLSLSLVLCDNVELTKRMIASCGGLIDEIIVVDQSVTQEAREYNESIATFYIGTTKKGFVEPDRQYSIDMCTGDWVLVLDPDEQLSPEFISWLTEFKNNDGKCEYDVDIFWINFKNLLRHNGRVYNLKDVLGDDPHPRLFRRGSMRWGHVAHSYPEFVSSKIAMINEEIIHDRDWETIKSTHESRGNFIDPNARQMEINFIQRVTQMIGSFEESFNENNGNR